MTIPSIAATANWLSSQSVSDLEIRVTDSKTPIISTVEHAPSRRRSQRVQIPMPVIVRGNKSSLPFEEVTLTASVNAHGCMLRLTTQLEPGEHVSVTNSATSKEQLCNVVSLGQNEEGKTEVGVEFNSPCPGFWHIAFPPEDWDPAQRKHFKPHPPSAPRR